MSVAVEVGAGVAVCVAVGIGVWVATCVEVITGLSVISGSANPPPVEHAVSINNKMNATILLIDLPAAILFQSIVSIFMILLVFGKSSTTITSVALSPIS
jgi:hypothetical protein